MYCLTFLFQFPFDQYFQVPFSVLNITLYLQHGKACGITYFLVAFLFQVEQSYTLTLLLVQFFQRIVHQVKCKIIPVQGLQISFLVRCAAVPVIDLYGHLSLPVSQFHQAVVLGYHIQPGFEILHPVFMQFLYHLQADLLYTVLGLFFVLQVLHAHTQQQEGVPLQEYAQPFIVMILIKVIKQLLVSYMCMQVRLHVGVSGFTLLRCRMLWIEQNFKYKFHFLFSVKLYLMKYAAITVPAAPVRRKPAHRKEMVNQLLFGETVQVLKEKGGLWVKIKSLHDNYEGWLTNTLITEVTKEAALARSSFVVSDLFSALVLGDRKMNIPVGACLPFFTAGKGKLGGEEYTYTGYCLNRDLVIPDATLLQQLAIPWLNAPYLWGGRTPLGVDCSGFVQVIFRLLGFDLPRDAWQQAQEGKPVKHFRDTQPGDLVFFDRGEEIVHVGIIPEQGKVIHASGKVRIDVLDKKGIADPATGKRSLSLKAIRRLW